MKFAVPTIGGIQRTNAMIAAVATLVLLAVRSAPVAIGCAVGAALMIGNLWALAAVGRAIIAMAQGGAAGKAGLVLAPFKLFLFAGIVYILIAYTQVNLEGFVLGAFTQIVAIFVETWHAATRAAEESEEQKV